MGLHLSCAMLNRWSSTLSNHEVIDVREDSTSRILFFACALFFAMAAGSMAASWKNETTNRNKEVANMKELKLPTQYDQSRLPQAKMTNSPDMSHSPPRARFEIIFFRKAASASF